MRVADLPQEIPFSIISLYSIVLVDYTLSVCTLFNTYSSIIPFLRILVQGSDPLPLHRCPNPVPKSTRILRVEFSPTFPTERTRI